MHFSKVFGLGFVTMASMGGEGESDSLGLGRGAEAGNAAIWERGQAEGQSRVLHKL